MKIKLHENGWTPIIHDLDWKNITQENVNEIALLLQTHTMVVAKKIDLSPDDEVKICSMLGEVENYTNFPIKKNFILQDGSNQILRVTGERDDEGMEGMFGHVTELDWHCNRVTYPDRKPIIWLWAERGSLGSRTSYINFQLAYNDLSDEEKLKYDNIELDVGHNAFGEYYSNIPDFDAYYPRLIQTNKLGGKSLFMPFNQVHFVKDWDKESGRQLIEKLRDYVLDPKFVYHHDWEDGDLIIADQWSGIHKRWEFAHMATRVLHRLATDYTNTPYC